MAHPRLEALTHDALSAPRRTSHRATFASGAFVEGREFPVKQLVREAANQLSGKRFRRHSCRFNGTRRCPVPEAPRLRRRPAVPGVRRRLRCRQKPNASSTRPCSTSTAGQRREASYNVTRFLGMVVERGGLETARYLLHAPTVSEGYAALWERKRLDLTVEAMILQPNGTLSPDVERRIAVNRLREYRRFRFASRCSSGVAAEHGAVLSSLAHDRRVAIPMGTGRARYLRERSPDQDFFRAWSNFEFIADGGSIYEVDVVVLTAASAPSSSKSRAIQAV